VELVCARCLEPVVEEVSRTLISLQSAAQGRKTGEARLKEDDAEDLVFLKEEGLFLADVLRETSVAGVADESDLPQ